MKTRRILTLLLTAALCLGTLVPAAAAGYTDLPGSHWAYTYLDEAVQLGVLKGMGDGRMAPDDTLTWAQCLTIAARTFAPEEYAAATGESWELVGYNACVKAGLLLPQGREFLAVSADADSLSGPISRQDTAVLLDRALPDTVTGRRWTYDDETWERVELTANETLADYYSAPQTHWPSVDRLFDLEILRGSAATDWEGNPITLLNGADTLRRCDGATMFMRALDKADATRKSEQKTVTVHVVDGQGVPLTEDLTAKIHVGSGVYYAVAETLDSLDALHYYTRYSEDADDWNAWTPTVSSLCDEYTLVYYPMNAMERARQDFYDAVLRGELSYEDYWWQPFHRYEMGENELKHYILFGDRDRRRYSGQSEAVEHQTTVTVPVWKIKNGQKYSSQASFSIHENLAEDVVNLFTEIYEDPEQFPIKSIGGFRWNEGASGEHNCGTAIDINPEENYQVRDGKAIVGSHWTPGEDPYSIPLDGSVARVMEKYGWTWGNGQYWSTGHADPATGYHDYMHFSYMGG